MPNHHRGEIEAILDGRSWRLCLTLGALAELEAAFGSDDMLALAERFSRGRLSAGDATRIIGAGLRGAGHDVDDAAVARMRGEGGAAGYVETVAQLLTATFGSSALAHHHSEPAAPVASPEARRTPDPFPGTR